VVASNITLNIGYAVELYNNLHVLSMEELSRHDKNSVPTLKLKLKL
jgi:hypothetical protein